MFANIIVLATSLSGCGRYFLVEKIGQVPRAAIFLASARDQEPAKITREQNRTIALDVILLQLPESFSVVFLCKLGLRGIDKLKLNKKTKTK